jgi:hypothetical protein
MKIIENNKVQIIVLAFAMLGVFALAAWAGLATTGYVTGLVRIFANSMWTS